MKIDLNGFNNKKNNKAATCITMPLRHQSFKIKMSDELSKSLEYLQLRALTYEQVNTEQILAKSICTLTSLAQSLDVIVNGELTKNADLLKKMLYISLYEKDGCLFEDYYLDGAPDYENRDTQAENDNEVREVFIPATLKVKLNLLKTLYGLPNDAKAIEHVIVVYAALDFEEFKYQLIPIPKVKHEPIYSMVR